MPKAKEYPVYKKGDLVTVTKRGVAKDWNSSKTDAENAELEGYGIIVGRTDTWRGAYEQQNKDTVNRIQLPAIEEGRPKRFWDDARYSPYRVMMCSTGRLEWVSSEDMEWVS